VLRRIVAFTIAFPAAVVLITLAVINRHGVQLVLDPFRPDEPAISLVLPFYAYLFGALLLGVVLGGLATWLTQSRWRRAARARSVQAQRWQAEASRLTRERDTQVGAARQLAATNR
jgi:uncharacterized integral membrane protein